MMSIMSASAAKPRSTCGKCGALLERVGYLAGQCVACLLASALDEQEVPTPSAERFDHYQVATHIDGTPVELGRGAMGITFKAFDTVLGNDVALKVIDICIAGRPEARERFLHEARAAARLRHPNVASVFYYGVRKSDGQCFYAMELVEGETLEARIRRVGTLPIPEALEIVEQVTSALAAAEAQGLVHRDLKPANLMLANGPELTVKVIDFGLAKVVATGKCGADLTHGGFVGTPAFASPEQFTGTGVDVRSDLYSLGVVLWEMLTAEAPFSGSLAEVMYQHLHAPAPLERLKSLPQPLVVLLKRLLKKDPAQRFQTPNELLAELSTITHAIEAKRTMTLLDRPSCRLRESQASRARKRSIAVLPFDSFSDHKKDAYFADGVQDEILAHLARVSQLRVVSRTSTMTYRPGTNRDLRSIARILKVANVVEGTVRKDGNRIRITVRLVDAQQT
jgi:serine/threonine protein kinase